MTRVTKKSRTSSKVAKEKIQSRKKPTSLNKTTKKTPTSPKNQTRKGAKKPAKKPTPKKTTSARAAKQQMPKLSVKRQLRLEPGEVCLAESDSEEEEDGEFVEFESQIQQNNETSSPTTHPQSLPDIEASAVNNIKQQTIPEELIKDLSNYIRNKVSQSTLTTYLGNRNSVIKRGFPFTLVGVLKLIMSEKDEDLRLSNQSIECIISTLKYFHFVETLGTFTEEAQRVLAAALATRKRKHPDHHRITGAMNAARTAEFERFLKKKNQDGSLDASDTKLFCDVSWTLYACALRVFQLRLLEPNSFYEVPIFDPETDQDIPQLFVKVRPKGAEAQGVDFERKQVHPRYASAVRKIIKARSIHTKLFEDFPQGKVAQFSELLIEAARVYRWPGDQRFSGTHCFRHGAAQDAFLESDGDLYVVKLRTGHLSKKAAEHYAKSDLQRSGTLRMHSADDNENSKQLIANKLNEAKQKITRFFHEKSVFKSANCLSSSAEDGSDDEDEENDTPIVVLISDEEAKSADTVRRIQELEKIKDPLAPYRRPMRIILPQLLVTPTEVVMPDGASVFLPPEDLNEVGIRRIKKGFSPDDEQLVISIARSEDKRLRQQKYKETQKYKHDADDEPIREETNRDCSDEEPRLDIDEQELTEEEVTAIAELCINNKTNKDDKNEDSPPTTLEEQRKNRIMKNKSFKQKESKNKTTQISKLEAWDVRSY